MLRVESYEQDVSEVYALNVRCRQVLNPSWLISWFGKYVCIVTPLSTSTVNSYIPRAPASWP